MKTVKHTFTLLALVLLVSLGVRYAFFARTEMVYDALASIVVVLILSWLYARLHQDSWSYGILLFAIVLHNLALYATSPFGIRFDHYMHFIGGFALALVADRFFNERWGRTQRFIVIVVFALGIGAIGEIIEWMGYYALGTGDGFFFYGVGDEGEWHNTIRDMIFNLLGGVTMGVVTLLRRR